MGSYPVSEEADQWSIHGGIGQRGDGFLAFVEEAIDGRWQVSLCGRAGSRAMNPVFVLLKSSRRTQIACIDRRLNHQRLFDRTRRLLSSADAGRTDWISPVMILLLASMGVIYIYSATLTAGNGFWIRQIVWIVLAAGVYYGAGRVDYKIYLENAFWLYLAALLTLIMLFLSSMGFPLLGVQREGAWSWLNFGFMSYQPAEGAKVATLIMIASILARSEVGSVRASLWVIAKVCFAAVLPVVFIFAQPDLGSSLVFPPMLFALLYVSRLSLRFFVGTFAAALLLVSIVAIDLGGYAKFLKENDLTGSQAIGQYEPHAVIPLLRDYQRNRLMEFISPALIDPTGTGAGWNARQSRQAVGAGGPMGKGFGKGLQSQLGYLPRSVAHNDFIFAVLAEERGFVGAVMVIGLFFGLLANGLRIAGAARDRFGMLLAVGVTVIFLIHVFINIGMTIGLTPITGLPLPFLSYGGSFLLSCGFLQGIVQSVHRHRRERW